MSGVTRPRGKLPARVDWFRRTLIVVVALALVYGFAHLLGAGGGASTPRAVTSAQHTSASPSPTFVGPVAVSARPAPRANGKSTQEQVSLAAPTGPCQPDEVGITPEVTGRYAGRPVTVELHLAGTQAACTFAVSPKTIALRVTSGPDRIWSSQDCPGTIPTRTVVVRSATATIVPVTWSGRRSDGTCSASNAWARPGYYHAVAAALGSEPADTQFQLTVPPRAIVTRTAHPKPKQHASPSPGGKVD